MTYADLTDLKLTAFNHFCGVNPQTFATLLKAYNAKIRKRNRGTPPTWRWKINCC